MSSSRRKFIKTLSVGLVSAHALTVFPSDVLAIKKSYDDGIEINKGYIVLNSDTQNVMASLADVLVPGSKDNGIKEKLMSYCNRDRAAASFIDAGLWNINSLSIAKFSKPFYELEKKENIKTLIDHIRVRNGIFFNQFRTLVIKQHYTDPTVWKELKYNGPPQPKGFLNYTEKP